ncbi:6267_t:CDS:2 [Entrophospora sp. SA101]|nr:6267_t:CDS:2 [Entrophospora sp. SA101]
MTDSIVTLEGLSEYDDVEVEGEDKDHQQDASTTLSGNFAIGDVSLSNLKTNSGYLYKYVVYTLMNYKLTIS